MARLAPPSRPARSRATPTAVALLAVLSLGAGRLVAASVGAPAQDVAGRPAAVQEAAIAGRPAAEWGAAIAGRPPRDRDSAATRRDLERQIARFQRAWRERWQESMIKRNNVIVNLELLRNDLAFGNFTYEVTRYQAIMCSAGWIGESELLAALANPQALADPNGGDARTPSRNRPSATDRLVASVTSRPTGTAAPDPNAPLPTAAASGVPGTAQRLNLLSSRRVRGALDKGQVCPQWIPEGVGIPIDEGERIDFALPVASRPWVQRSRDSLIARLDAAAAEFPTDEWIAGQRVRFLLDNAYYDRARDAAEACGGARGWCEALRGLVLDAAGRVDSAERAFRAGDAAAALGVRGQCADTATFALLPEVPRLAAHGLPCEEQRTLEQRIWWLADPLWSVPGNPRYTAHQSRLVSLALRGGFAEDERYIWRREAGGEALRETIVRYGWPTHTYWGGYVLDEQINKGRTRVLMDAQAPYTAKEYAPDRAAFIPSWRALREPLSATPEDWELVRPEGVALDAWWPAEHMAITPRIYPIERGQVATLRRDHTLRVGIAVEDPVRGLEPFIDVLPSAVLVASPEPTRTAIVADTTFEIGSPLRVIGDLEPGATVLSLEVPGRVPQEVAHRRRFGFAPPPTLAEMRADEIAVADPIVVRLERAGELPPVDPDDVLARMAGTLTFGRETPLALYWESYGLAVGDTADVEVRIARRDENSALRTVGAFFGLADARRDSISIRWREPDPGRAAVGIATEVPTVGRALALNLSALAPGRYAFIVVMRRPDGAVAQGERVIELRP